MKNLDLIASAYGFGAGNTGCSDGPLALKAYIETHTELGINAHWHAVISSEVIASPLQTIAHLNQKIAHCAKQLIEDGCFPINIGGDHSCAIGMWSGIAAAKRAEGNIGLIWIDAHLDAHTFETTPTGNIHGMPVAALLGYGEDCLTHIGDEASKLKPEHIVILGARSYEDGEHALLQRLGVTIYYMEDIKQNGFKQLFEQAVHRVSQGTVGYGISFDLDGIDPKEAPGVGTPVPDGLNASEMLAAWKEKRFDKLIALEVVEYNPQLDKNDQTLAILLETLKYVHP